jgi:hypothetical protein
VTIHRSRERLLLRFARAIAIGGVAFSLAPATASARPDRQVAQEEQQDTGSLDWGAVTLGGGAVALLVVGALGMAAADDRRYLPTSP